MVALQKYRFVLRSLVQCRHLTDAVSLKYRNQVRLDVGRLRKTESDTQPVVLAGTPTYAVARVL